MTGALLLNPEQVDRYTRAAFELGNTGKLTFSDRRRLGLIWLSENDRTIGDKLGPEPLSHDFTVGVLAQRLEGRQAPIKAVLLDQTLIAGVGNMYADEALFSARIHPMTRAGSLSYSQIQDLHSAIVKVLCLAIRNRGASVDTYKRPGGEPGTAHFSFRVAHRRGEHCPVCGASIERLVIRNRGSYLCPDCQKE
jgi:formamidopyrimidine-DNA glycosylase